MTTIKIRMDGAAAVYFENQFETIPIDFYIAGELTVTKKLLGADGRAKNGDGVFYAGIFADKEFTTLSGQVSENILTLDLTGGSSASAAVEVTIADGVSQTLYVTEVDQNGNPVIGSSGFEYEVSVDHTSVTVTRDNLDVSVTITNRETEAEESETEESETEEIETEKESESTKTVNNVKNVQTGDDTPIVQYVIILLIAAMAIGFLVFRHRGRNEK